MDINSETNIKMSEVEIAKQLLFYERIEGRTCLDLGGGFGLIPKLIGFNDVTVLDFDDEFLNIARDKFGHKIIKMDLNKLPLVPAKQYDFIYCSNLLEHVKYPAQVINFAYESLNKNGLMVTVVPNEKYTLFNVLKGLAGMGFDTTNHILKQDLNKEEHGTIFKQKTPHINFFNYDELAALHKYAGFDIVNYHVTGKPATYLKSKNLSGAYYLLCRKVV